MACSLPLIAASVLTADFSRLGEEVELVERAGADRLHWDVMDGCFVPNLTIGPDVVASVRDRTTLPFEAHLMVTDPDPMIGRWVTAGCQRIIVHAEACRHLHRSLAAIREAGAQAGVALNPATPLSAVEHVIDLVDLVLIMTVNPGFGGQRYIDAMEAKVASASALVAGRSVEVEVDGGINVETIAGVVKAGAETTVVGSALYRHEGGMAEAIKELHARAGLVGSEPELAQART
ncbi:MAG: ribulose-phosphate 3-epimerase [Acidimicrobiales bacterium]